MLFGVLYVVFTEFVRFGGGVQHYPACSLIGHRPSTPSSRRPPAQPSTRSSTRENLVRKIHFPRLVIPLSVVLTSYLNFVLNFVAVSSSSLIARASSCGWSWLEIVPLVLLLGVFRHRHRDAAVARCSSATATSRRSGMWRCPLALLRDAGALSARDDPERAVQQLVMCNPLAAMLQQARHALIDPSAPSAAEAIGGTGAPAHPARRSSPARRAGILVFNRAAPRIAEDL